jgi:hypothetical protein
MISTVFLRTFRHYAFYCTVLSTNVSTLSFLLCCSFCGRFDVTLFIVLFFLRTFRRYAFCAVLSTDVSTLRVLCSFLWTFRRYAFYCAVLSTDVSTLRVLLYCSFYGRFDVTLFILLFFLRTFRRYAFYCAVLSTDVSTLRVLFCSFYGRYAFYFAATLCNRSHVKVQRDIETGFRSSK